MERYFECKNVCVCDKENERETERGTVGRIGVRLVKVMSRIFVRMCE